MITDLFGITLLGGLLLSFLLPPLGCYLLWQRMAFLGDTLSHSAILGVALGSLLQLQNPYWMIAAFVLAFTALLYFMIMKKNYPQDVALSVLSYGGLSFGMMILHFTSKTHKIDRILFGDLLSMTKGDLLMLAFLALITNIFFYFYHKKLLLCIVSHDLAKQWGVRIQQLQFIFFLMATTIVAVSMQWVGALLTPALLIIPCATVFQGAGSPKRVIKYAVLFSTIMFPVGILIAFHFSSPIGPTITSVFILGMMLKLIMDKGYRAFKSK